MDERYSVELSAEDIEVIGFALRTCRFFAVEREAKRFDHAHVAIESARPVQPSALERLTAWVDANHATSSTAIKNGQVGVTLLIEGADDVEEYADTLADAVNAALDAAEVT